MSSYLSSYFGSGSPAYPQQQQQYGSTTPGSTSTWTGTFSSRIATLRKALTKDSEEDDPDNEDCSHVSNVLRAYYTEKGRPFPEWLPPDPKKPASTVTTPQQQYGQYGNAYGGQYGNSGQHDRASSGGRGGLSDLWDSGPTPIAPPAQSLRAPRPTPQSLRSHDPGARQSGSDSYSSQLNSGARPLPSQRAGSHQNTSAANAPVAGPRDRLRARLQSGGSGQNSPAHTPSSTPGSYNDAANYGRQNSSESGASPYNMSASEPWSNSSNQHGYDANQGSGSTSSGYGNPAYRNRSGGPR